jgi:predicted Zn-dependent peptidase
MPCLKIPVINDITMQQRGFMYNKFTLKNGTRVVYELLPHVRSVSIGIWIKAGVRNESMQNNGISHFIEHMLFKGTQNRSAAEIAGSIDNIGGQLNAFTGKECTCYHARVLDEHIETAIDVLSDMFYDPLFAIKDISLEKKIIMEEIAMYEDNPEELVHDILTENVWAGCSIGYPILGTRRSLRKIKRDLILSYYRENYTPGNTVISVAGNFDEIKLKELLEKYFGQKPYGNNLEHEPENVDFKSGISVKEKETEQVHLCIGFEGVKNGDDNIYTLLAINNVLGGSMSSRLFQKIRERKGLVYSIYSYPTVYNDAGLFTIYAGMNPENLGIVSKLIHDEIQLINKRGITPQELEKSKEQLKGSFVLGLESTGSRMNSIGKSELLLGYVNTPEEIIKKIENITMDCVMYNISRVFNLERKGMSIVGAIKNDLSPNTIL